ncbi:hypothetical protein EDD18DRAFT_1043775, partial [Armillaria luteobubalina]
FSSEHPLHGSHHVHVCPPEKRKVPNFVGRMLPHVDKGDREYYCLVMLVLFRPWRSGVDLKGGADILWDTEFDAYPFTEDNRRVMANFNLRYECLDAQDDFRA